MSASFGKSKSKTASQQQETSTQTLAPELSAALYGNVAGAQRTAGSLQPYTGQRVAGFNENQTAAQQGLLGAARAKLGSGLLADATAGAQRAASFAPLQINSKGYTPAQARPVADIAYNPAGVSNAATANAGQAQTAIASQVNRGDIRDISSGAIDRTQIDAYMNPYTDDVVTRSLADLERQRAITESLNNAAARKSGAFGGTGAAIAASLGNEDFTRRMAQTSADLRSRGYENALGAAQQDAARALEAARANQSTDLGVSTTNAGLLNTVGLENMRAANQRGEFNAGLDQQAALANAEAANRAALSNAQGLFSAAQTNAGTQQALSLADAAATNRAWEFNAGQDLEAQRANQSAGVTGAQLNLGAAQALANLSDQERAQAVGDVGLINQVGEAQQAQSQREIDGALAAWREGQELTLKQQEILNAAIGLLPNYGTTKSSGTASSKGTQVGFSVGTIK